MFSRFSFAVLIVLVATSLSSTVADAQEDSWAGKTVILKRTVKLEGLVECKTYVQTVLREKDGKLEVRYRSQQGWFDKNDALLAEAAVVYFSQKIAANPKDAEAHGRRGAAWFVKNDLKQAMQDFDHAIELDPKSASCHRYRGLTFDALKQTDKALGDLDQAVQLDPQFAEAYINKGDIFLRKREEYPKAAREYSNAIRIDPKNAGPYRSRGYVQHQMKKYEKAISDYTMAVQLDPKQEAVYNNHAWLLATCPEERYRDGKKALELAKRACELSQWKNGLWIDTFAAAHAEAGNFETAVKYQMQALQDPNLERTDPTARERLELYKQRKPYREMLP